MNIALRQLLQALAISVAAALGAAAPAGAEPPSVTAFFKQPQVQGPRLSPSGRYLAITTVGRDERARLAVIDLQHLAPPQVVAGFNDADIRHHHWLGDDRLVFELSSGDDGQTRVVAPGLWAVDRNGDNARRLIRSSWGAADSTGTRVVDRTLENNWRFVAVVPGSAAEVFVAKLPWAGEESSGVQFARLDTRNGRLASMSYGLPDHVVDWKIDWQGEPRAVIAQHQGQIKTYLRQADGSWKLWQERAEFDGRGAEPYWFGPGGQTLALDGYRGNLAVFQLDPATLERKKEPLISFKGYDYQGQLIFDPAAQRLLGLHYETDAPATVWLDPAMKAIQADIDARLPGTANQIECERCLDATHLIVTAYSDQRPPVYLLYKPADKSLQTLAGLRPDIRPSEMGQRDYVRIKARDGLEIPVLVTQPPARAAKAGRHPTVVLVHGGPYVRGTHWAWEPDAQFLASRGYLVLEPEFRGSTGYGFAHFRAGWKQWGLAMQDDLADTLAWAVKQGWADPQRACIMGASYGGYAALMGAVSQGELFKCAVDWVGVTDIGLLSSIQWSDASDEWKRYGMAKLVGDPQADAAQIKATSPLQRASEIKIPLLMAYGGDDRRVPIKHGTDMKSALRRDQALEWVVYPEEGHGWRLLKTNEDFWGRVERFLGRHIGPASPAAMADDTPGTPATR